MVINSDHSLQYFPENVPYRFKTKLQESLTLRNKWKIALVEITLRERVSRRRDLLPNHNIYVYSTLCGEIIKDGNKSSLLRRVIIHKNENVIYTFPYYIPVVKNDINEIEFIIRNNDGQLATDILQPVTLVLHFKACPFYG